MSIETTPLWGVSYWPMALAVLAASAAATGLWLMLGARRIRAGKQAALPNESADLDEAGHGALVFALIATVAAVLAAALAVIFGYSPIPRPVGEPTFWDHAVTGEVTAVSVVADERGGERTTVEVSDAMTFVLDGSSGTAASVLHEGDQITVTCQTRDPQPPEGVTGGCWLDQGEQESPLNAWGLW